MKQSDIKIGGLYSIRSTYGEFTVVKVLDADDLGVCLRAFGNVFPARPDKADIPTLTMEKVDKRQWPMACVPVLSEGFLKDDPILLTVQGLTDEEQRCVDEMWEE